MNNKIIMRHPEKWGEGYYINEQSVAFRIEEDEFVEVQYINPIKDSDRMRFNKKDVIIK